MTTPFSTHGDAEDAINERVVAVTPSVFTANGTLVGNRHNRVDASAGQVTMTMPSGQSFGTVLSVEKVDSSVNTVLVSGAMRGGGSITIELWGNRQVEYFLFSPDNTWWPLLNRIPTGALDQEISDVVAAAVNDDTSAINSALSIGFLSIGDAVDTYAPLPGRVRKSANQSITSSATFVTDGDLQQIGDPNTVYRFEGEIRYEAGVGGDLKVGLVLPTGATAAWTMQGLNVAATASPATTYFDLLTETGVGVAGGIGAGLGLVARIRGEISTATASGPIALKWAQNTSNAVSTIAYAGSWFDLTPLQAVVQPPSSGLTNVPNGTKITL